VWCRRSSVATERAEAEAVRDPPGHGGLRTDGACASTGPAHPRGRRDHGPEEPQEETLGRLRGETRQSGVAFTLCLALSTCGGDQPGDASSLPPGTPIELSPAPILVVGERPDDPDHELYRVVTPFLLPDGRIGVPLSNEGRIRIFDGEGEYVGSLGSAGQGPGEFAGLAVAWARGDTIEAFDRRLNRLTRFVAGQAPETIPLEGVERRQSEAHG